MWPFSKSPPDTSLEEGIKALKDFRDKGETFNYLGRNCIVTAHTDWWPGPASITHYPCLKADYADANGVIRSISFRLNELPGLKAQNP